VMIRLIAETRHGDKHLRDHEARHSEQEELSPCGKRREAVCVGGEG
jgi:hypothetical protein